MSTVHDRFTISSFTEGFIAGFKTFPEALEAAQHHKYPHSIEIFDVMAHLGKPQLWDYTGMVISFRSLTIK